MVFFFEFVYIVDYIDGYLHIEPSLHPWDEAWLIMFDDPFNVFLDLVCENFIEYFCIGIHKGNSSEVLCVSAGQGEFWGTEMGGYDQELSFICMKISKNK